MAVCALLLLPRAGEAQVRNGGTLTGVVQDTSGAPLADVTVLLMDLRRQTRSRADGSFRFDSVKPGPVRVSSRAVGYIGAGVDATVLRDSVTSVKMVLVRFGTTLPTLRSTATRLGLSGVIGDTSYRALRGVRIKALGGGAATVTDSLGQFFLPLKPGSYVVRSDLEGFRGLQVSVTIPRDEGVSIAQWMEPIARSDGAEIMRLKNLWEFERRIIQNSVVRYRILSRDDLRRTGANDLAQASSRALAIRPSPEACAMINGGPQWAPLWSIDVNDVELMEANLSSFIPRNRGPTSIQGNVRRADPTAGGGLSGTGCQFVAWTR
jgi:hypothetical protein